MKKLSMTAVPVSATLQRKLEDPGRFLWPGEAGAVLGVAPRTITSWCVRDKIPHVLSGRRHLIRVSTVLAVLRGELDIPGRNWPR